MKIKSVIIDDEPLAIQAICLLLQQVPFVEISKTFHSSSEALEYINTEDVDCVFTDINMPDMSGIELIKNLKTNNLCVVFTTAHSNYAIQGFELGVVDYLLKPFTFQRLLAACCKAQERTIIKEKINSKTEKKETEEFIFVKSEYSLIKVNISTIYLIEGLKDYVKIYSTDFEKPILTLQSLKALENTLPFPLFYRVHKSFIVNVYAINSVVKGEIIINKRSIPIGNQYKETFLSLIEKNIPK